MNEKKWSSTITGCLKKMGVSCGTKGFYFIRSAVDMVMEHLENHGGTPPKITKEVYPRIAEEFQTTAARAERAIRHSIEMTMRKGNAEYISKVFDFSYSASKGKPTNAEFIATIADYLLAGGDEG